MKQRPELEAIGAPLVRRSRLTKRLLASPPARMVLLLAPAGFSKTTCLNEWDEADHRPFAWVQGEGRHDDPVALARAVFDAIAAIAPLAPDEAGALSGPAPSVETMLPSLREALAKRPPFVLVVDDVHAIDSEESNRLLASLAEALPTGSQLALGSRAEPQLPLGRMRAHRQLIELAQRELALTAEETGELLENLGLRLSPGQVEVVRDRTEGWPAATYLAGLSLADQPDLAAAVRSFAGDDRFIVDYLRDEFFTTTSEARMRFLTRSAVLDELSGPICDFVLDRAGSARVLRELSRVNSLIVPLDRNDTAYRYHHLFAELLCAELHRREPELEPELHARASEWYAGHEDPVRATDHAIAAGDPGRAGDLMWTYYPELIGSGRIATMWGWLEQLGDEVARRHSALSLAKAHCLLTMGDGHMAALWTGNAAAAARGEPGGEASIEADLRVLRANLCPDGVPQMGEDAARASEMMGDENPWQTPCHFFRGVASHLMGHPERAKPMLREAVRRGAVYSPIIQVLALTQLALIALEDDRRDEALRLIEQANLQVERCGMREYGSAMAVHAAAAMIFAGDGRLERAHADTDQAVHLLSSVTDFPSWYEAQARIVLARAMVRLGRSGQARQMLADAEDFEEMTGDAAVLLEWHREAREASETMATETLEDREQLTKAELRTLQYLPSHLSFREIGDTIHVSPNTVKTQAQAAYRKLGASSRAEAVEKARQAGLLPENAVLGP